MIKLMSIQKDGSNPIPVWVNGHHVITVEADDGVTTMVLADGALLRVAESVEYVVEMVAAAK